MVALPAAEIDRESESNTATAGLKMLAFTYRAASFNGLNVLENVAFADGREVRYTYKASSQTSKILAYSLASIRSQKNFSGSMA